MDNVISPINATYPVTPPATYADASSISAYEQILELDNIDNLDASTSSSSGSGSSVDASLNNADLLNLSPAALNVLNGIQGIQTALQVQNAEETGLPIIDASTIGTATPANAQISAIIAAYNSTTQTVPPGTASANGVTDATATSGNGASTTTTLADQQQIANIIAQYSTAPLTPATVTQINNALANVGINAQQLSLQEILFAYAAFVPTQNYSDLATSELTDELLEA